MPREYPVKLSIAVATYNQEKYLAKALESIFEQKHDYPFEVVVSDDCSTDKTREIIGSYVNKYPAIMKPIFQKKNIGVSKNALQMLRACRGEYIATLDGDDYWTNPDKLKIQITFLDNNPEFVISCHRLKFHYQETDRLIEDANAALFKDRVNGFTFGSDSFFEHWMVRAAATVFRNSALENTSQFETQRYCSDVTIFWNVLSRGKGYAHNFIGGVYLIHSEGVWSGSNALKQAAMGYEVAEQLLMEEPGNPYLQKFFSHHQTTIRQLQEENTTPLELSKVKNKNFTIISDDGWGAEVYKAFNLQELSPFIGINIYNADFIELASNLNHYLSKSLNFIHVSQSKYSQNFKQTFGRPYPIALLGNTIELHFISYESASEAEQKWNERIKRINWNNLFLKMDISREDDLSKSITKFESIKSVYSNKACFLNVLRARDLEGHSFENSVKLIDNWNPEGPVLFSNSNFSFDLIGWLNGGSGAYTLEKPPTGKIPHAGKKKHESCPIRYDDHFFIKLNENNIGLIDTYFAESFTIDYDADSECTIISYNNKSDLENFRLSVREEPSGDPVNLFLDLTDKKNRHVFVLAKGEIDHVLRVDFVAQEEYDIHLNAAGLEQSIPGKFEWIHFDLSAATQGYDVEHLFGEIKSFCFYINPEKPEKGTLAVMAIFIGPTNIFEKMITQ